MQVKKNAILQLTKWETDRAALQAVAEGASNEAAVAAKVHQEERADLSSHANRLDEKIREMEIANELLVKEAEKVAGERYYRRSGCYTVNARARCVLVGPAIKHSDYAKGAK